MFREMTRPVGPTGIALILPATCLQVNLSASQGCASKFCGGTLAGDWKSRPPLASSKADLRRLGVEPAKAGFAVVAAAKRAVAGLQKLDGHPKVTAPYAL